MSNRTRIWVNFSKEYIKEYEMAIKEDNFSGLICRLLRDYYSKDERDDIYNKIIEIYELLKNNSISIKDTAEEEDEDFETW